MPLKCAQRRQPHADPVRAPHAGDRLGHLEQEAGAVLEAAAVAVGAPVGAVAQELVDQVAVGAVDLDAVEAGRLGAPGAVGELGDDARDLRGLERARDDEGLRSGRGEDLALGGDRRGRDRQRAVRLQRWMARSGRRARAAGRCGRPPACTASVTRRQPATCASLWMPGVPG